MGERKSKEKRLPILFVLLLIVGLLGCQAPVPEATVPETAEPPETVTTSPSETSEATEAVETVIATTTPETEPATEPVTEPVKETEAPKETQKPSGGSNSGNATEKPAATEPPATQPPAPPAPTEHTHSYTHNTVSPTCTSEGYTEHTCSCGDSYRDSYTQGSHSYAVTTSTSATCQQGGSTTYACSVCGDSYAETTPATDHSWEHKHTEEVKHQESGVQCACGAKFATTDEWSSHIRNYDQLEMITNHGNNSWWCEWVIDTPASDTYTCSVCGATK